MSAIADETVAQIHKLVRAKTGDARASVHSIEVMPGHAGFSYGFVLERSDGGDPSGKMVVRIAPPGVKISGPADIVRQAKIMASLANTPVPVPQIFWYGDEPEFFGRPYLVDRFVESFKLGESDLAPAGVKRLARKGIEILAELHNVAWEPRRQAFGEPVALGEEMKRLDYLLDRDTLDPAVVARAPELRERLRSTLPVQARIGCVHGDFQWANVLFDQERPVALIDWEIALIGPTLLDVGWVSFFADRDSFVAGNQRPMPLSPEEIAVTYSQAASFPIPTDQIRWFRAFAGFRFGVITCFNLMLHRRGKRVDPLWEETGLSAPRMFERGIELLG
ncbi:MAG TPA: phosphotransferase family protein [Candidatus Binataceae bacterium]|jgi:aminoglycoside phosphotransferase (APT) family kinase protein